MKVAAKSFASSNSIFLLNTTLGCKNVGVWVMKGVVDINDKKNNMLPFHRFVTPTNNTYAALAKNDNTDVYDFYTPISVLKQVENNTSFVNSIASKVGVNNNDALAKKVNKVNTEGIGICNSNNNINTIDSSKEGVETINIVYTPSTGNNSNTTITSSKVGMYKMESNYNNTSHNEVVQARCDKECINRLMLDFACILVSETCAWYTKNFLLNFSNNNIEDTVVDKVTIDTVYCFLTHHRIQHQ